jgi:hypothetical protein
MFTHNPKQLWINYLCGSIEGGHTIEMILGNDGKVCKGLYTLRSSKQTFYFEGEERNQQLQLVEMDENGLVTGFLYGRYDGQLFEGLWLSKNKKLVLPFKLDFVNAFSDYSTPKCRNTNWIQHFEGDLDNEEVQVSIKREEAIYTTVLYHQGKKYVDAFPITEDNRIIKIPIMYVLPKFKSKYFVIDTLNLDKLTISGLNEGQYEDETSLKSRRRMAFECTEYADFSCRLKCNHPVLNTPSFDKWMGNKMTKWVDDFKKDTRKSDNQARVSSRWAHTANAWVEVDLFMDELISGTIFYQSSWIKGTEQIPFIFDIKNGKEIVLKDLFVETYDPNKSMVSIIDQARQKLAIREESKEWFLKNNFSIVTLKESGFCFRTPYSTIHGEQEVVIPYTEVADKIKNKNLLKLLSSGI